jgi:hypothetical protein
LAAWLRKTKTPPPVWQWGLDKNKFNLTPNCHATPQQRAQQQSNVSNTVHFDGNRSQFSAKVNPFRALPPAPRTRPLKCGCRSAGSIR